MLQSLKRTSNTQKLLLLIIPVALLCTLIYLLQPLIAPFFLALIFSYLLNPIVNRLEFIFQKRVIATIALYILLTIGLIILFNYVIPPLLQEFNELSARLHYYVQNINQWILLLQQRIESDFPMFKQFHLVERVQAQFQEIAISLVQKIPTIFFSTFSAVSYFLLMPIILLFFLIQGPDMKKSFFQLVPNKYFEMLIYLFYTLGNQLGNYLRGIFVETLIIGGLTTLMLFVLGVDYSILLGIIAGVANIIPYIGPIIGAIPAIIVFYLKMKTVNSLLAIVLGFVIVQSIDNVILKPIIYSQSVDLHPLTVIISLVAGGILAGVWGLILAVPFVGMMKVLISVLLKEIRFRLEVNQSLQTEGTV